MSNLCVRRVRTLNTSGCIFHEAEWLWRFFFYSVRFNLLLLFWITKLQRGRSQIKKAIRTMLARFLSVLLCSLVFVRRLITFYIPIKIMLNSAWINWSTILSWVPMNNGIRKKSASWYCIPVFLMLPFFLIASVEFPFQSALN